MDIRKLRISKNITQKQLAKLTGLSQQHISKIEKDLVDPNYATLKKIANALGYKIAWEKEDNNDNKTT